MFPSRIKSPIAGVVLALAFVLALPSAAFAGDLSSAFALGTLAVDDGLVAGDQADAQQASVFYSAHVQGDSWQDWVSDRAQMGDEVSLDALKVKLESNTPGSVQYQVFVGGGDKWYGWHKAVADGKRAGIIGDGHAITGVRIALTGELSRVYSIAYRVKCSGAWQKWRKDGVVAKSSAAGAPITAIQVKLVEKAETDTPGEGVLGVRYRACMQDGEWRRWNANNATSGSVSGTDKIYALALALDTGSYSGDICYRVRLTNGTWKPWKKNGAATEKSGNIEAVQIKLTGEIAEKYDVVYRANIAGVKWQKRVRNGETAGTTSRGLRLRGIRVELVDKDNRTGWVGGGTSWRYFKNGVQAKKQWVVTKESPIDEMQGSFDRALHYWIDSSGYLAVDRIIKPKTSRDSGAGFKAYAMAYGYIMTDSMKMINKKWYSADSDGHLTVVKGKRSVLIERYVLWAINIAKDNSHGYSQKNRWGPDYDCSSLVVSALSNTGFQVGDATWTGNLKSELKKYGFRWYSDLSKLKRGDILLVHNNKRQHTEIYIGNGKTVGAHIAETGGIYGVVGDQTGNEISVGPYYSIWQGFLRYVGK